MNPEQIGRNLSIEKFAEKVSSGLLMSPSNILLSSTVDSDLITKPLLNSNHTVNSESMLDRNDQPQPFNLMANPLPITPVNLEDTFWYMKQRQWARIQRASHGKPRTFVYKYLVCYLVLYGVYLALQLRYFHEDMSTYALEYILMGFLSAVAGFLSPRFGWLIKTVIFEAYGYLYTFFLMNMYTLPKRYVPLSLGFFALIILSIINYLFYPMIIRAWYTCTGDFSSHVEISDTELGTGKRYEFLQHNPCSPSYHCVYEGGLIEGKPHSHGTWIDTSYQGEFLTGYWREGYPIGPFESMENDTRNLLVNLRIIYCSNAGGRYFLQRIPLSIGVACVEACVSGNFFKDYPIVGMITGPTQTKITDTDCIKRILERRDWIHIDDDKTATSVTVSIDPKYKRLNVTGFHSESARESKVTISLNKKKANGKKSKTNLYLSVGDNWKPAGGREGILFIHGIYHTLEDALKRFGQFLALGHFPAYIKPFLFNWPAASNPFFYFCAASVASDNDTHRDLHRFLKMLKKAGILTLHIMCHSMGSRFFLRSFPVIRSIFRKRIPRGTLEHESTTDYDTFGTYTQYSKGINLQNLILMNPDYETETFTNDYVELQDYITNISVYADSRDGALVLANNLNGKASLGLSLVGNARTAQDFQDLDIIDTSDLDRNMESQFHGYFNINRMMVDDLYELIVTGKRAEQRTSRLKPYGKVYRFTLVPSSVVMV